MSKIRIKRFGPIQEGFPDEGGWLDIKKVTVFIGNQGSGKSTVAKLISAFMWAEKSLVRGDYTQEWFEKKNRLKDQLLRYHRLDSYLMYNGSEKSVLEYEGEACRILYQNGTLSIEELDRKSYQLPQIMYVPSERNFVAYVKSPKELKLSSDALMEFLTAFENAKQHLSGSLPLPVNQTLLEFDKLNDTLNLQGAGYKIGLTEASSGFLSLVPLYLVSWHLAETVKKQSTSAREPMSSDELLRFKKGVQEIWANTSLTEEQRQAALSVLSARFTKTAFINIVEEPEQNLFPDSQQQLLYKLLALNNLNSGNKLIITTHSPYLINFLTLAAKAADMNNQNMSGLDGAKVNQIVPHEAATPGDDLAVYQFDEQNGSIRKLPSYNGLPSDAHELNASLDKSNESFAELLEIQQQGL